MFPVVNRSNSSLILRTWLNCSNLKFSKIIEENPVLAEQIHEDFAYQKAEIVYAARFEMARSVEDVLARRTRILFLDATAAILAAPLVAKIMAKELLKDQNWIERQIVEFNQTAMKYLI